MYLSLVPAGDVVGVNDMTAQTAQTIRNLKAALAGAGAGLEDVIKVPVYLSDFPATRRWMRPTARSSAIFRPPGRRFAPTSCIRP